MGATRYSRARCDSGASGAAAAEAAASALLSLGRVWLGAGGG